MLDFVVRQIVVSVEYYQKNRFRGESDIGQIRK
jgi:hypothetical protein